jgi:hypothetical protein
MNEELQPKRGRKSDSYLPWLIGAAILLYYLNQSGAILPRAAYGPTTIPDPYASVQGGGQGFSVQSLSNLSLMGPYSTVG